MSLQLSVIPSNAQATVNLSWSGSQPNGILEYLIFYYQVGSVRVKSVSTTTLSTVIPNLTNGVTYNFRATAFLGGYSSGQQLTETSMVQVICCTQPDAPANLEAVVSISGNVINQEIQLTWTSSFSNASHPVLNYKIYLSSEGGSTVIVTPDATASYNLTGLNNGIEYTISVSGVNLVGEGAQCDAVTATPLGLAGPPTNVVINFDPDVANNTSAGYQSVDLEFTAPEEIGGTDITSYTVVYSLDPSFVNNVQSVSINGTSASVQDANLVIPYADRTTSTGWFYFKVCAVNAVGAGPFTSAVTLVAEIVPNAVTNLSASNLDADGEHAASTVTLSWGYDIDNSTPLLGYIVAYLDTEGEMVSIYVNDVSGSPSHTIGDLQNGVGYDFSVFGINMLGAGPSLDVSQIPSTVPDAPEVEFDHANQTISMTWSAPYDEGDAITSYNIYRITDSGHTYTLIANVADTVTSYDDESLVNGNAQFYAVAAVNANGEGQRSSFGGEYPSTVPDAPANIMVTNSNAEESGEELTVSWSRSPSDQSSNGGSIIIQFHVRDSEGNLYDNVNASSAADYSLTIPNLVNGQSYTFRVSASNRDGEGAHATSDPASPSGLPDAPSGLSLTNSDAHGAGMQATISIDALNVASGGVNVHSSDEGSAFDHFQIYRDGVAMQTFNGTSFTVNGLVNGQQYSFAISAINGNGEGAQCEPVTMIPSCPPDAATGLAAIHGDGQVSLSWNTLAVAPSMLPSDQGSAIEDYYVQRLLDDDTWGIVHAVGPSVSSYVVDGLINGESYSFRILAVNLNGNSISSAVTATPSTSPSAVRNVHIVGNASELQIIWDAPADVNDHPSGGLSYLYNLEVADGSGGIAYLASGLSDRYVEVQNLNTNVQYTVSIYAYNSIDTNFITYSTQATTVPSPVEITSLQWDADASGSLMRWNYASDVFSAIDFLLVIMDVTTGVFSSVFCPAKNAIPDETIVANDDGSYSYSYALTHLNTETLSFADSDQLKVMVFARNADGISPMSNVVQVR
jgi:titin